MASSPIYDSLPLDSTMQEIRLLQFEKQDEEGVLHCTMAVYRMDAKYQALSYEWGVEGRPKEIVVNGHNTHISQNLYTFLQRFQQKLGLIWIDQLCIDQGHLTERNDQVRRMGSIFRGAVKTWVWLGQDRHSGLAVKLIQSHKSHREDHDAVNVQDYEPWKKKCHEWVLDMVPVQNNAYETFCRLTYWNRQWIVQEIAFSCSIILIYGCSEIDYEDVANLHLGDHFANVDTKSPLHLLLRSVQAVRENSSPVDTWTHAMLFSSGFYSWHTPD